MFGSTIMKSMIVVAMLAMLGLVVGCDDSMTDSPAETNSLSDETMVAASVEVGDEVYFDGGTVIAATICSGDEAYPRITEVSN